MCIAIIQLANTFQYFVVRLTGKNVVSSQPCLPVYSPSVSLLLVVSSLV
jgi:hypothetical protein